MLNPAKIRRGILEYLYKAFKEEPHSPVEFYLLCDLVKDIVGEEFEEKDFEWNLIYLKDAGYVSGNLIKLGEEDKRRYARITHKGIDLIENPLKFDKKFPPND